MPVAPSSPPVPPSSLSAFAIGDDGDWEARLQRAFDAVSEADKSVRAPPRMEMAEVAWPLIAAHAAEVAEGLDRAVRAGAVKSSAAPTILDRLVAALYALVFGATSRIMVVELAAAESTGLLLGDTPEEQSKFFVDSLDDPSFGRQILNQYPVLKRQLVTICDNWRDSSLELLARLTADRPRLKELFLPAASDDQLADISVSVGDSHCRGRATCILLFASGVRLVYKPRPLALDVHFRALADWVNERLGNPQIRVPVALDRGTHGWSEFITHEPVRTESDLTDYYERLGAILALAYLTGVSDLHAENVIAHGAWPVLVDLETLFRPRAETDDGAERLSNRLLLESVAGTHLLAARVGEGERRADMGGIVDQADQTTPFKIPVWENIGRVDVKLVYEHRPLTPAQNVPRLGETRAGPAPHRDDIVRGFSRVYRLLEANRRELKKDGGLLDAFRDDPLRLVLRSTSQYMQLLVNGFHPDYLEDPHRKQEFFRRHLTEEGLQDPAHDDVAAAEIDDLWLNDVPYFSTLVGGRAVLTSRGAPLSLRLQTTGLEAAYQRIDALGPADLARQCWLIELAFAGSDNPRPSKPVALAGAARPADPDRIAQAIVITAAEELCTRAICDEGARRASWLTVREENGLATVSDAALDLYCGLPGIALFLCAAARMSESSRYLSLARFAVNEIVARIDAGAAASLPVGGFGGSGGLAYALQEMASVFPELRLDARAVDLMLSTDHAASDDLDVIDGLAGALLSCMTLYRHALHGTGNTGAAAGRLCDRGVAIGRQIAGRLMEDSAVLRDSDGLAHGRAGVALALGRLFCATGDAQIGAIAGRLLNEGAPDDRASPTDGSLLSGAVGPAEDAVSWCRGMGGVALALLEGRDLLDDRRAPVRMLARLAQRPLPQDHSLCHGGTGVLAILQCAAEFHDRGVAPILARRKTHLLREIADTGLVCGTVSAISSPGLMDGLAGIGLGALYLIHPDKVPFVLSLDGCRRTAPAVHI